MKIRKIVSDDKEYPGNLKNIHKPPSRLYVNGRLEERDGIAVAIVGSRRGSHYGLEMAEKIGYELAVLGVTVVSGMARGIDSAAHRGALRAKGRTIAVMGSGHRNIYPPENAKLYDEIASSGAVVTEYEDGMPPLPENFPARNRIISGLSLGLIVVEAARNSGALITAGLAAEQGREVFALPGRISSSTSAGTNDLIRDGATMFRSVDDVMEELKIREMNPLSGDARESMDRKIGNMTKAYIYNSLTDDERKIYKVLSDDPVHIDEAATLADMAMAETSRALVNLQLKRLVLELPGKNYVRKGC